MPRLVSAVPVNGRKNGTGELPLIFVTQFHGCTSVNHKEGKTFQLGKRMESCPEKLLVQQLNMKVMQESPLSYLTDEVSQNENCQMRYAGI